MTRVSECEEVPLNLTTLDPAIFKGTEAPQVAIPVSERMKDPVIHPKMVVPFDKVSESMAVIRKLLVAPTRAEVASTPPTPLHLTAPGALICPVIGQILVVAVL